MHARVFHHAIQQRSVQRHDGDRRTGLADDELQDRNACLASQCRQPLRNGARGAIQVFLCLAERRVPVDRPRQFRADIRIRHRLETGREHAGGQKRIDPEFPVLAAHHSNCGCDFLGCRRFEVDFLHHTAIDVQRFDVISLADRLDRGAVQYSAARMLAHRRREAVHHQIDLPEIALDPIDYLRSSFDRRTHRRRASSHKGLPHGRAPRTRDCCTSRQSPSGLPQAPSRTRRQACRRRHRTR